MQTPTGGKVRARKLNRWNSGTDSKAVYGTSLDGRRCVIQIPPRDICSTWKALYFQVFDFIWEALYDE